MKKILILSLLALFALHGAAQKTSKPVQKKQPKEVAEQPLKIVFQLSVGDTLAHKALMKQLGNITSVEPTAQIEVVCHGPGLDMLRKEKSTVAKKIDDFTQKGIVFNACEFSMKERNVNADEILSSSKFVKAGIVYIVRKQQAGWSYIKSGF